MMNRYWGEMVFVFSEISLITYPAMRSVCGQLADGSKLAAGVSGVGIMFLALV
jgi:hypothetical protein